LKLRGQRVEPGEVESVLVADPSVKAAVVAARPGPLGDPQLVAWVVPHDGMEIPADALRAELARRLPRHMVPSAIVPMDALPLGPGGKIDRAALPDPSAVAAGEYVEPYTPEEIEMADLWSEVLGVPRVGASDDFFVLGGHSLLAVRLMARIRERFGRELPLAELFRAPTLSELAAAVARAGEGEPPTLVALHAGGTRPPLFFVHPAGGTVFRYAELARALGPDQPFYGLQARGVSDDQPPVDSMEEMVERYAAAIREAFPSGPYLVGGWSAGGPVAFALAARLREMGEDAPLVIILDAVAPGHGDDPPAFDDVDLYLRFTQDLLGAEPGAAAKELEAELRAVPADQRQEATRRWIASRPTSAPPGMVTQIGRTVRLWEAMDRALRSWRPPRFDGDVLLIEAEQGSPTAPTPPGGLVAGWAPYVGGRLEYRVLPGAHVNLVLEPWVAAVAREITRALEMASAREAEFATGA
ncbi:MAG TPA: thioesterase domain-containing protein, partial [Longimicrobiaceae bacterium]